VRWEHANCEPELFTIKSHDVVASYVGGWVVTCCALSERRSAEANALASWPGVVCGCCWLSDGATAPVSHSWFDLAAHRRGREAQRS
jgi:hypothetical protein